MNIITKHFRSLTCLIIISLMTWALTAAGCTRQKAVSTGNLESAESLLANSLKATNAAGSYRFKGTGAIEYMDMNDRGTFVLKGDYKNPGSSHLKLEMLLGQATYHIETICRNHVFYSNDNDTWKITPVDPNTMLQPAYKPVDIILEQLQQSVIKPTQSGDLTAGGQTLHVIKARSNQRKLKALVEKDFARSISIEPERKLGMENFLRSLSVNQDYTLFIDSKTDRIVRIIFSQNVTLGLQKTQKQSKLTIDYSLYDYGAKVTIK